MNRILILFTFVPVLCFSLSQAQETKVPGTVVNHIPASTRTYIGSPGFCILPGGDYVASHDHFGPSTAEHEQALTSIYKSQDKGKTWKKIAEINGQFWSNLFVHRECLYILGTWKHHGNLIIRRSTDGGLTWSEPVGPDSGLLLEGEYHTAPMPVTEHRGRLWRAVELAESEYKVWGKRYSAMMISAPVDSNLLEARNWKATNSLEYDSTYLDGKFGGWLEGNAVVTPEGKLIDFLRVSTTEKGRDLAAIVNISEDGSTATFDPEVGFIDFVGGARKFTIRYDQRSGLYWTITNMVTSEFTNMPASSVRNTLVLQSSPDLGNWSVNKILLHHPDVKKHGFQYVEWQFSGRDILFLSRTAYDDPYGGAHNYHDANYLTFHRIKNFRKLAKENVTR